jgi:BOP1NT (NUC169) domain
MRLVPAYQPFIRERFERCLDLYLCPRTTKLRRNVDPKDLLPDLPKASVGSRVVHLPFSELIFCGL